MSRPRALSFVKGHGTQNDFVLLPDPEGTLELTAELVRELCDRRTGIGGDGVLRVVPTACVPEVVAMAGDAPWFMDYRNADGSIAEMCGNGVRVYARYLIEAGLVPPGVLHLATRGGVRAVTVPATGDISVDMGPPEIRTGLEVTVTVAGRARPGLTVSMGNPHVAVAVDSLAEVGELRAAPEVRPAEAFATGTNVEFVVEAGPGRIAMRVFERGVGETRSCGTGACAAAVAADRWWGSGRVSAYVVDAPGGSLRVTADSAGHLHLAGPAVLVAEGTVHGRWIDRPRLDRP